ncbi:MAG: RNB domain-containing ribonuclease, partial [Neisseriaceae bacterium]|nr:RNB domain-containing ribonuclease [Neisseriaceae bacterium]
MNIFYEETGHFKCANVIQRNDASYQADTSTGKRVKVKASNVFFEFNGDCVYFLEKATQIASEIDIELMWEATNSEEFSYEQVANEYFGNTCSKEELAATLIALYSAPIYFHKKSKGKFKAADEKTLKLALAAIERKKIEEQQIDTWVKELSSNSLPESIANDLTSILHKPDKQSLTYKAFSKAAETLKISPLDLAFRSGGLTSIHQYLFDDFLINCFADEITLPEIEIEPFGTLPEADGVYAFSIDDSKTTEIDDAISVIDIGGGKKRLGIHIAAPSLSILA